MSGAGERRRTVGGSARGREERKREQAGRDGGGGEANLIAELKETDTMILERYPSTSGHFGFGCECEPDSRREQDCAERKSEEREETCLIGASKERLEFETDPAEMCFD